MNYRRLVRRVLRILLLAALIPPVALLYVSLSTAGYRYEQPANLQPTRVAMIFGAGVRPDGRPSPMLAERVEAGVALYQSGMVQKLLMTGDNSRVEYDEVTAMKQYAMDRGVPERDITLDYAGFSTYESCYRAQPIFGVSEAILITQRFHLARAVYTCRTLGVQASGLAVPDWERYPRLTVASYIVRESLAMIKALIELHITRPAPTFLGPFEDID
jgi:vancomycin permeability regulator SanA